MFPNNILKEHLEKAIQQIDEEGIENGAHSSTYDVIYNDKRYPPKLVVSLANKYANGVILQRTSFKGGKGAEAFKLLNRYGFEIVEKLNEMNKKETFTVYNLADKLVSLNVSRKHFNIICTAFVLINNEEFSAKDAFNLVWDVRIKIGWDTKESVTVGRISQDCQYYPGNQGYGFYSSRNDFENSVKNNQLISEYEGYIDSNPSSKNDILGLINLLKEYVFKEMDNDVNATLKKEIQELYNLKSNFLKKWPLERLQSMSIEEYTNLDKTSFCYWVEQKTKKIGGIRGGSSYKFGIYRMASTSKTEPANNRTNNGVYAWFTKYGNNQEEAFQTIKNIIIKIATFSQENDVKAIDDIDLGDAYKWKVAFLYGDFNIINMFNKESLKRINIGLNLEFEESNSISELNQIILNNKPINEDFFEYSIRVWNAYAKENEQRKRFEKWLRGNKSAKSGMISSYIRAINILINHFDIEIYDEIDITVLNDLYEDLKLNQRDSNGKYYYSKSKSYGNGGFYSAAVKLYIDFLTQEQLSKNVNNVFIGFLKQNSNEDLTTYFTFLFEVIDKLGIKIDDKRIYYSCTYKNIAFTIGQRISWTFMPSNKGGRFQVLSMDKIRANSKKYTGNIPHPFHTYLNKIEFSEEDKDSIYRGFKLELERTNKTSYKKFNNKDFENAVFDKTFREQFIKTEIMKEDNKTLNTILYGPPGTGKTYNTVNRSLEIAAPNFDQNQNREIVMKKYDELLAKGQIVFTTFHQSLSYEDFVEGIKPTLFKDENENDAVELQYEIGDGIFKQMVNAIEDENLANKASKQSLYVPQELFEENIVKISLGNSLDTDDDNIYKYCMENNVMAIGFGEDIDFNGVTNRTDIRERFNENGMDFSNPMDFNVSAIERFLLWAKKGRLVFASHGTKFIKAIGVIDGDYYCDTNSPIRYSQFKPVKWLHKDLKLPIKEVYNKLLSQQSIYEIDSRLIKKEFFAGKPSVNPNSTNRVLIIDEINRGNVSAIFGELITLIEEDKRQNEKNALSVTLPYSKESFSVPNNLFIIGTMNTADRSVEALDTALRRRFSFIEMMPDYEVLNNLSIEGISLKEVLEKINDRVELLIDRDHTIGHSYFMDINSPLELAKAFNDKIAPLLQEYFYGDYGKIGLVLGEGFVKKAETKSIAFAPFKYEDSDDFKTPKYSLLKVDEGNVIPAIKKLLGNLEKPSED